MTRWFQAALLTTCMLTGCGTTVVPRRAIALPTTAKIKADIATLRPTTNKIIADEKAVSQDISFAKLNPTPSAFLHLEKDEGTLRQELQALVLFPTIIEKTVATFDANQEKTQESVDKQTGELDSAKLEITKQTELAWKWRLIALGITVFFVGLIALRTYLKVTFPLLFTWL